jgi:ABC-type dipeptide/oligopeptide/nickel transport system permease subunit
MSKELKNQVTPITRRRMFKNKNKSLLTLRISATIMALLFAVAIFQPFFYTADPAASDLSLRLQSPSLGGALLGTDALGQDVYSRVIAGFIW